MSALKTKEVQKNLCKKGFESHHTDHEIFIYVLNGKKTNIRTKISHGETEIGDPLISMMARQLHLSKVQFTNFAKCIMSEEEYKQVLSEQGENI